MLLSAAFVGLVISVGLFEGLILLAWTGDATLGPAPTMSVPSFANLTSPPANIFAAFDGIREPSGSTISAPDPQVAAGPYNVVEMANKMVEVFSKQGTSLKNSTFNSFFNTSSTPSDPRVIYDASSGRFFATIQVGRLAVSNSNDAMGSWKVYNFAPCGGDALRLGVSDDKVVTSTTASTTGPTTICALSKSDLVAWASSVRNQSFTSPYVWVEPVQSLSPTTTEYMVSTGLTPTNVTRLFAVTGTPPNAVIGPPTNITIADIIQPVNAPGFEGYNSRVQSAAWFKGKLWYGLNDGCTPPGATQSRACIRLTEINTNTSSIIQDFDYGEANKLAYYPALGIDGNGNIDVVYGISSAIAVTGQNVNDPFDTLRTPTTLKSGGSITGRWGDYFGAGVDPSDQSVVWVAGEYVPSGSGNCLDDGPVLCWGTHVASMSVQPASLSLSINPAMLNMTAPAPGSVGTGHANLTVTSHAFSGQVTLSNSPNYETALSGPLLSYSQTIFNMSPGQTISIVVSIAICSSTPSRTFTITGSSGALTSNVTFIVNVTGQRSGSCPS